MKFITFRCVIIIMWNLISSNRFLEAKMRKQAYRRHKDSLNAVKPQILIKSPPKFQFLASNPKRNMLAQQQLREIQNANTDLVRRMAFSRQKSILSCRDGYENGGRSSLRSRRKSRSISKENQKILSRLRDAESFINFSKFEKDYENVEKIKTNIRKSKPLISNETLKRFENRPFSAR